MVTVVNCPTWLNFKTRLVDYAKLDRETRDSFIFRGHADAGWDLKPTLDRTFPNLDAAARTEKLKRLLHDFAAELLGVDGRDDAVVNMQLELLGRHHGLPTTVLDWTKSPYIACYFAFCNPEAPPSGEVCVWAFDKRWLVRMPADQVDVLDDLQLVARNVRAIAQRAVFVRVSVGVHVESLLAPGLLKFTIPWHERRLALTDLDEMLITARSLFGDRDGAAKTAMIRESIR